MAVVDELTTQTAALTVSTDVMYVGRPGDADPDRQMELDELRGWLTSASAAYTWRQRRVYTTSGTFAKGSYAWLRGIRVHLVAGGAGGGGAAVTGAGEAAAGGGGGGGGYGVTFVSDIANLPVSATVTVGGGGLGGSGAATGGSGGTTGFQVTSDTTLTVLSGSGGGAGTAGTPPRAGGLGGTPGSGGDGTMQLRIGAAPGHSGIALSATSGISGTGGMAAGPFGGGGARSRNSSQAGGTGSLYGSGGSGGLNLENQATARDGGAGREGIVVLDLYA